MFESVDLLTIFIFATGGWLIFLSAVYLGSPPAAQRKLLLWPFAVARFLFSMDRSFNRPSEDPSFLLTREVRRKRIYFIRHAESAWNVLFNKGFGLNFIPNLLNAIIEEFQLLPTSDSVFLDSPLSSGGIAQALALREWIASAIDDAHGEFLRQGESGGVAICTSPLRRAVSTLAISMSGRLARFKNERIQILSPMQELTRNFDGVALTEAENVPAPSSLEKGMVDLEPVVEKIFKRIDGSYYQGTLPMFGMTGLKRWEQFSDWVFNSDTARDKSKIIACGHSLWIREMMKFLLPANFNHSIKQNKIVNCGVIAFDLVDCGGGKYAIDPVSVQSVVGGFEGRSYEMKNLKE